jgi:hypothetical protein
LYTISLSSKRNEHLLYVVLKTTPHSPIDLHYIYLSWKGLYYISENKKLQEELTIPTFLSVNRLLIQVCHLSSYKISDSTDLHYLKICRHKHQKFWAITMLKIKNEQNIFHTMCISIFMTYHCTKYNGPVIANKFEEINMDFI